MCLTLRCHVEPKIAWLSNSDVQSSGYVWLGSHVSHWYQPPGAATRAGSCLAALWNGVYTFF